MSGHGTEYEAGISFDEDTKKYVVYLLCKGCGHTFVLSAEQSFALGRVLIDMAERIEMERQIAEEASDLKEGDWAKLGLH